MTRGINVFLFPAGEGERWRAFHRRFRGRATQGMIRRYFHEGSAESLELHLSAPLDACPCHVCKSGPKLGFMWSGDTMTVTPREFNGRAPLSDAFTGLSAKNNWGRRVRLLQLENAEDVK